MMALHGGQRLLDAGKPEAQFYSGLANAFIFDIGLLSCGQGFPVVWGPCALLHSPNWLINPSYTVRQYQP